MRLVATVTLQATANAESVGQERPAGTARSFLVACTATARSPWNANAIQVTRESCAKHVSYLSTKKINNSQTCKFWNLK